MQVCVSLAPGMVQSTAYWLHAATDAVCAIEQISMECRMEQSPAVGRCSQAAGVLGVGMVEGSFVGEYSRLMRRLPTRRCIDKAGGLDAYILNTPDKKLGSDVGAELRREMLAAKMVPPPHRTPKVVRQPVQPDSQGQMGQQSPELAPG